MPAGVLNRLPDRDRGRAPLRHRQGHLPDLLGVDRPPWRRGAGRRQATRPGSPVADLAQARRLIESHGYPHGYRRRLPELEDAEAALRGP